MRPPIRRLLLVVCAAALDTHGLIAQGPAPAALPLAVRGGMATFEVATNVFGTKIYGKSSALTASAVITGSGGELLLQQLEATLPPASLKTGIKLRDQHMIKYIFRTTDGQVPDVRFSAGAARCTRPDGGAAYTCPAIGTLSIRNEARPFSISLEATPDRDGFKVRGVSSVTLSAYGIDRPSQFGVSTEDTVKVQVEFVTRRSAMMSSHLLPTASPLPE